MQVEDTTLRARLEALERQVQHLAEENRRLHERLDVRTVPERMSRRGLLLQTGGLIGAVTGTAMVGRAATAMAASSSVVNYQGRLTATNGIPANGLFTMLFTLWSDPSSTNASYRQWSETQTVNVSNGLFSVYLGSVTALPPSILSQPLWLGITVNNDSEMQPREQLGSAPAALEPNGVRLLDVKSVPYEHILVPPPSTNAYYNLPLTSIIDNSHGLDLSQLRTNSKVLCRISGGLGVLDSSGASLEINAFLSGQAPQQSTPIVATQVTIGLVETNVSSNIVGLTPTASVVPASYIDVFDPTTLGNIQQNQLYLNYRY